MDVPELPKTNVPQGTKGLARNVVVESSDAMHTKHEKTQYVKMNQFSQKVVTALMKTDVSAYAEICS